jgi:ComF family protein
VCGERLVSPHAYGNEHGEMRCGLCRRMEQPYLKAGAYGSYDGGLRDLIHMLKYEGVRPAANVLGRMLSEVFAALDPGIGETSLLLIPVPLHGSKMHQRGFNQAESIARAALKLVDSKDRYRMHPGVLERVRATQSQIGLTRHQRRENLRGAFRVTSSEEVSGCDILLVDDVFTTGTTVSECARVLRRAGARRVWVATVARTLKADAHFAQLESGHEARTSMAAHG